MAEPTTIHTPAASAPTVTDLYARCNVCGVEWQVRGDSDTKGCSFCGASARAIAVISEGPTLGATIIYGTRR